MTRPSAAGFAGILMVAQMLQRGLTFVLNTLLLRHVSADVFGYAANDMELLMSTILFISREGVRIVALRTNPDALKSTESRKQLVNLAWLPVCMGFLMSSCAAVVVLSRSRDDLETRSTLVYCAAAALEALSEPFYIIVQVQRRMQARATVEVSATLARVFVTFITVALFGLGPLGFAAGQLVFATTTLLGYLLCTVRPSEPIQLSLVQLLPSLQGITQATNSSGDSSSTPSMFASLLGRDASALLLPLTAQSLVKHLLTEGDKLLLSVFASRDQRGAYAVVQNYGSLVARLVFQPLEEATRTITSGLFARANSIVESRKGDTRPLQVKEKDATCDEQSGILGEAKQLATSSLFAVLLLGLFVVSLGPGMASSVAAVLLGGRWAGTEVPQLLAAYCIYVPFMAANGVTEAVATAAADSSRVTSSTLQMCGFFAVYAAVAIGGLRSDVGTSALIAAGCLNLALRAFSAWNFLTGRFARSGILLRLHEVIPRPAVLVVLSCAHAATWVISAKLLNPTPASAQVDSGSFVAHMKVLGFGATLAIAVATLAIPLELTRLRLCIATLRGRAPEKRN